MWHKNKLSDLIIFPVCVFLILYLIANPEQVSSGIYDGVMVCFNILIPSLFPISVLAVFLINCGIVDKLNKNPFLFSCAVFSISLIGGYPIGAKIIETANKNKLLNNRDSNILLTFCINGGPAFIITAVGKVILNHRQIGLYLFFAHILASSTIFAFNLKKIKEIKISANNQNNSSLSTRFIESVATASTSMMGICSYVILFSGVVNLIDNKLIIGLLEISNGMLYNKNIYLISFLLGFSGICIILQVISIAKDFISNYFKVFFYRVLHGSLSVVYLKIIFIIFPIKLETITNNAVFNYKYVTKNTFCSLLVVIFVAMFLYSLSSKKYCGKIIKDIW